MYITGLIHRDRFFNLAVRWLMDRVEPDDGRFATKVFIYDQLATIPTGRDLMREIHTAVRPDPIEFRSVTFKDDLRAAIIEACRNPTPRQEELFERFCRHPEEFFPGTPVDLILATAASGALIGMVRFKRIQRVADKASRRIADRLAEQIERAAQSTSMDWSVAEDMVCRAFQEGTVAFQPEDLRIDDLVGYKFVGNEEELAAIEQAIREHPRVRRVEREVHQGIYNDVNLLIDVELPSPGEIVSRRWGWDWSLAILRGLDRKTLERDFGTYVEAGARTFRAEVILTTFDELVESEFGRSIHEERVLYQRSSAPYTGRIARNASYIVEYLLRLAISPTVEVDEVPFKMWGRYLPASVSLAIWRLFGVSTGPRLFDSLLLESSD